MTFDDPVRFRATAPTTQQVGDIAARTDLTESDVYRRLLQLGLADVEEIGDEILLGETAHPPAVDD